MRSYSIGDTVGASADRVNAPLKCSRVRGNGGSGRDAGKSSRAARSSILQSAGSSETEPSMTWRTAALRRASAIQVMSRRDALATTVGAGALLLLGLRGAASGPAEANAEIAKFFAGRRSTPGQITIDVPAI